MNHCFYLNYLFVDALWNKTENENFRHENDVVFTVESPQCKSSPIQECKYIDNFFRYEAQIRIARTVYDFFHHSSIIDIKPILIPSDISMNLNFVLFIHVVYCKFEYP